MYWLWNIMCGICIAGVKSMQFTGIVKLVFLLVAKQIEIREFPENRDYVIKDLRICSWRSHKPDQISH